jgi:hypothetical protein
LGVVLRALQAFTGLREFRERVCWVKQASWGSLDGTAGFYMALGVSGEAVRICACFLGFFGRHCEVLQGSGVPGGSAGGFREGITGLFRALGFKLGSWGLQERGQGLHGWLHDCHNAKKVPGSMTRPRASNKQAWGIGGLLGSGMMIRIGFWGGIAGEGLGAAGGLGVSCFDKMVELATNQQDPMVSA